MCKFFPVTVVVACAGMFLSIATFATASSSATALTATSTTTKFAAATKPCTNPVITWRATTHIDFLLYTTTNVANGSRNAFVAGAII